MPQDRPLYETTHAAFTGMSRESFDMVSEGDEVIFTIRGICKKNERELMKTTHDVRRKMIVEIVRVVEGISDDVKVDVDEDGEPVKPKAVQPSLHDSPTSDPDDPADRADAGFTGGPSFSAGDE